MSYTSPYRPSSEYHERIEIDLNNCLYKTHFYSTIKHVDSKVSNYDRTWEEAFNLKVKIYFDYMSIQLDTQRRNGFGYDPKNLRDFEATVMQIERCATSSKVSESYARILDSLQAIKNECRNLDKENIVPLLNQGFSDQQVKEECEKKLDTQVSVKIADSVKKTRKLPKCPPKAFTFAQTKFLESTQSVHNWHQVFSTQQDLEAHKNVGAINILPDDVE